jgi:hypothetical protein
VHSPRCWREAAELGLLALGVLVLGPGLLVLDLLRGRGLAGGEVVRVLAAAGVAPGTEHPAEPAAHSASAVVISRAGPGHGRRIVITLLRQR